VVRDELRRRGLLKNNIVRYCYRPFDVRWLYWEPQTKLLDEKRTDYFLQVFQVLSESPGEFSLDYLRGCESRQRSF
jgi:hypothetical protein